ncbi:MAG TPA: hypothetical protein VD908_20025 [Cytophagales bacterium]|nr:hypothetical protein [Cytophagales bacterium]
METNEKEKRPGSSSEKKEQSPTERIETPFPAQEIFPLEQSNNDGKKKHNVERIREENEKEAGRS